MGLTGKRVFTLPALTLLAAVLVACGQGGAKTEQPAQGAAPANAAAPQSKKEFVFKGKVEQVDAAAKKLTVNGENVEGWMPAMTMIYGADNDAVFGKIKPGDQITARVYEGDFQMLHNVEIVP
jgi:Cu/Ag efflux protein CusF